MSLLDFELIDLPVEFKQINPNDFDNTLYNVAPKTIITPNDQGFISPQIVSNLIPKLHTKDTVVINAGVGQGKSYSVIELIKEYSKLEEYVVILAVPFNNLINQYVADLTAESDINTSSVFNMMKINNYTFETFTNTPLNYGFFSDVDAVNEFQPENFKVHVMSINALLGNSGDNILFQSNKKVKYFNSLQTYCEANNKKIILFFDEIHDSIHNFREDLIYGFWRYQNLIHKIFVVSATFNEASKEVIKYLSEFTNKEIQILESERKVFPDKQSQLHLIFNEKYDLTKNDNFMKLFERTAKNKTSFDFIVYSKKQIESNFKANPDINQILQLSGSRINYCYADTFDKASDVAKYEVDAINIGTNFTTGVNITKENHVMFIFIPIALDKSFINNNGVFRSIPNSVIQALARQRKAGDIYIIMPPPRGIKPESLPFSIDTNQKIIEIVKKYKSYGSKDVSYTNINKQYDILDKVYNSIKERVKSAELNIGNAVGNRFGMNRLQLPAKEIFILEKGEQYLSDNFFDGSISTYIFWAAITNQFLNCRLNSIIKNDELFFTTEDIQENVFKFYHDVVMNHLITDEDGLLLHSISGIKLFEALEHEIINSKVVYINGKKATKKDYELIRLLILHVIVYQNQKEFQINQSKNLLFIYSLQSCVTYAKKVNFNEENKVTLATGEITLEENLFQLISIYKDIAFFIEEIRQMIVQTRSRAGKPVKKLISISPNSDFISLFREKDMASKLNYLKANDRFLSTNIFPFKDTFSRLNNEENQVLFFYGKLIDLILKIDGSYRYCGNRYYLVTEIYDINTLKLHNFLYTDFPNYVI